MFEKEASEKANKKYPIPKVCNELDVARNRKYEEGFKDGAEFGYNKGNEWYKVADGDLPSEEGGWVCNQNGLPCFFDWGTEQWLDCEGTQIRTTEWCHMPHKE